MQRDSCKEASHSELCDKSPSFCRISTSNTDIGLPLSEGTEKLISTCVPTAVTVLISGVSGKVDAWIVVAYEKAPNP